MSSVLELFKDRFNNSWISFYKEHIRTEMKSVSQDEHLTLCPFHNDIEPSLTINGKTGLWYCHGACQQGGDAIKFYQKLNGISDFKLTLEKLSSTYGLEKIKNPWKDSTIEDKYDYLDENNKLRFQVVRFSPKDFRQRRRDSRGSWVYSLQGIELIPYNLPEVIKANIVFIVEGEQDVKSIHGIGFVGTTNASGAGKWLPIYNKWFKDKIVYIIPDNDMAGYHHATVVGQQLTDTAKEVRIILLNDMKDKADITDFIEQYKDKAKEELIKKMNTAPTFEEWTESELTKKIKHWITLAPGEFTVFDIDKDLMLSSFEKRIERTAILENLIKQGYLARSASDLRGRYRPVNKVVRKLTPSLVTSTPIDMILPFGIHNHIDILEGNIIVVSGTKNAGKSAFLLNIAKENKDISNIHYFSSEMFDEELRRRLNNFGEPIDSWKSINWYARKKDFQDVVIPGKGNINLIDYMELYDDFYKVAFYIAEIFDKLNGAIAVIALQKEFGKDTPRGGAFAYEKARLAIALEPERLKVVHAKNIKPNHDINGAEIRFKLKDGAYFQRIENPTKGFDNSFDLFEGV